MIGPVEVHGAAPGDALEITVLALRTIDWGWNSFPLGVGALPADFKEPYLHYFRFDESRGSARFEDGIGVPLRPLIERNRLAAEANERFVKSAIAVKDVYGTLEQ
jgi:acetamidase/formamidase